MHDGEGVEGMFGAPMELEVVGRMLGVKGGRTAYENMLEVLSYTISFASFYIFVYLAKVNTFPLIRIPRVALYPLFAHVLPSSPHLMLPRRHRSGRSHRPPIGKTAAPGHG